LHVSPFDAAQVAHCIFGVMFTASTHATSRSCFNTRCISYLMPLARPSASPSHASNWCDDASSRRITTHMHTFSIRRCSESLKVHCLPGMTSCYIYAVVWPRSPYLRPPSLTLRFHQLIDRCCQAYWSHHSVQVRR